MGHSWVAGGHRIVRTAGSDNQGTGYALFQRTPLGTAYTDGSIPLCGGLAGVGSIAVDLDRPAVPIDIETDHLSDVTELDIVVAADVVRIHLDRDTVHVGLLRGVFRHYPSGIGYAAAEQHCAGEQSCHEAHCVLFHVRFLLFFVFTIIIQISRGIYNAATPLPGPERTSACSGHPGRR